VPEPVREKLTFIFAEQVEDVVRAALVPSETGNGKHPQVPEPEGAVA
jgi:hypothetical protein